MKPIVLNGKRNAPRPQPEEPCAARRLEGWPQGTDSPPSFETRARSALLRMRLMNDVDMIRTSETLSFPIVSHTPRYLSVA
jgi:hypothetical protein